MDVTVGVQLERDAKWKELSALKAGIKSLSRLGVEKRGAYKKRKKQYIVWCKENNVGNLFEKEKEI